MENEESFDNTSSSVVERREAPRFFFLSRADVKVPGHLESYWGSVVNISRTGLSLQIRQSLPLNTTVMVNLRFMGEHQREAVELLSAKVMWRTGEHTGLKFEAPLTESSPIAQRVPRLMEHLHKKG
jgi:hypothetical protein